MLFGDGGRFNEAATAIRAEQAGLTAQLLRELPDWERAPTREPLDAIAHIFVALPRRSPSGRSTARTSPRRGSPITS